MSAAVLKKELDSVREEIKELKKEKEDLRAENKQLSEENEQVSEQNRKLLEENESSASRMELLQAELSQNQVFSQQEIEQLSRRLDMLQKDAELERLRTVDEERRKWETKEDRLNRQLDAALKKLERAEEQIEHVRQCEEHALPQSHDEASNHSGLVVPSPEPETEVTTSQGSPLLSSEQPSALTPLSTPHSAESVTIPGLSSVSSSTTMIMSHSTQSYPVMLSGFNSVPSVTDLMTSDSPQSPAIVTQSAVNSLQLPVFSMATVTIQSEQVMPTRQSYSLITAPSVSWTGQRPPFSCGARQIVTPGHTFGRDLNTHDRVSASTQSALLSSSDQGAVASSPLNLGVFANQIPPIPKFSGEVDNGKGDLENFTDWKERFEMVAEAYHWDERTKLVNLVTRLCGQAYSFYRSCDGSQRSCCAKLVEQLTRRFMPVRIGAVQSSLFHDRRQKEKESVDDYAQELRKLFYKAYPQAMQGTTDLEDISKSILCNQFVAGLLPDIKIKVAGTEGSFETLLTKARFEEAKLRDLGKGEPVPSRRQNLRFNVGSGMQLPSNSGGNSLPNTRCYKCGSLGHIASNCPLKGRRSRESQRPNQQSNNSGNNRTVNNIVAEGKELQPDKIELKKAKVAELQKELQDVEREVAMAEQTRTMHGITCPEQQGVKLGLTPTTEVNFEGMNVQALLDTGSPVTIVSAKFLFQALAKHHPPDQTIEEWEDSVRGRLQYSSVKLKSYGGGKLNIIGQIEVKLERGSNQTKAVVQIQKEAPVQLLIGTDLLSSLGVLFLLKEIKMGQSQIQYDLLQNITLNLQATEFVPAIEEKVNVERQEATKSTTIFKNNTEGKECDSAKVFGEVCNKNNSRQPEISSFQSGEVAIGTSNNNCQPENSSFQPVVFGRVGSSNSNNSNNNCQPENSSLQSGCPRDAEECATVHMLQAVRLPGRHEKLVKLKFNQQHTLSTAIEHLLLEPDQSVLHQFGLDIESALLNLDKDGCATVPVCNYNMDAKHLDKDQAVGKLYPVTLGRSESYEVSERTLELPEIRALNATESSLVDERHWEKLCHVLRVNNDGKPDAITGDIGKFYQVLKLYADVFVFEDGQLGSTNVVTHSINTGDSPPIKQPARRIPFALRKKVEELVDDMLQKRVIHPSNSPWASPVVLVAKKNGDTRFCVDYRRLNSVTKMDVYPLPRIDDMLDSLSEACVFSTLDLASGFWQLSRS